MSQTGYYRQPTICADLIVFVCEDDLWSVPRDGGVARRLTSGKGEVTTPRLSPVGSSIAFAAREEGNPEVYVMPSSGGSARQLTYLGGETCLVSGWTPDGAAILFASDAGTPFIKETRGMRVDAGGGNPEPLPWGHLRTLSIHADGRLAIGRNNDDPARWKRYRGGTAGEIWVDARGDGRFTRPVTLAGNTCWPMWHGDRLVFLSDHEGIANLYSVQPDGSGIRRLTHEREYYARFPATDGQRIVYAAGGQIRVLDVAADTVSRVPIETPSTAPQTARRFVDLGDELDDVAPSPDGTKLALMARGRIFTMPLWEEAALEHGDGSRVRYREAAWLADGKRFVCVSDADGGERLEIRTLDSDEPIVASADDIGRVVHLAASPAADVVAIANHRYELLLVDLQERRARVIDKSLASLVSDLAFSPDGRWLAYSCAVAGDRAVTADPQTSIIRIAKVKSGAVHDVTPLLRVDRAPTWDPDGKYLYFLSFVICTRISL